MMKRYVEVVIATCKVPSIKIYVSQISKLNPGLPEYETGVPTATWQRSHHRQGAVSDISLATNS